MPNVRGEFSFGRMDILQQTSFLFDLRKPIGGRGPYEKKQQLAQGRAYRR